MHYASIWRGRAADNSGNYQRVDHSSVTDFSGGGQNNPLGLPCHYRAGTHKIEVSEIIIFIHYIHSSMHKTDVQQKSFQKNW